MTTSPESELYPLLSQIRSPRDVKSLPVASLDPLAEEIRTFIVSTVTRSGGHLGSNLGAVELTIALHRAFSSPNDVLLFDTGHQGYVHKLLTGRMEGFARLREEGGLSGYPSRAESPHDVIENSHASTALSYAYGVAAAFAASQEQRRVVAVVGDGALTGGMAYEALNNLGHSSSCVLIVLNDNGRSYAPTVSKLSESLTQLRLHPSYSAIRQRLAHLLEEIPAVGNVAGHSLRNLSSALRELVEPHVFFEALGVRYTGPIDGHDIVATQSALEKAAAYPGPIVLHLLTRKGKGYGPAEADEIQCLHDLKAQPAQLSSPGSVTDHGAVAVGPHQPETSYTETFSKALLTLAHDDDRIVAITAAMPGPTGLLSFEARYPDRFFDVGIAEQHAMGSATAMALFGLRPVVAVYSTFLGRCFDQENFDMGLHSAPVVICADRAGVTGDDGPSHHGLLDMVLGLCIPGLSIFAPAEPSEIKDMLATALSLETPSLIRFPKTPGPISLGQAGSGLHHRQLRPGKDRIAFVGIGKMAEHCLKAAELLWEEEGIDAAVYDPRVIRPLDSDLVEICLNMAVVVTAEDGFLHGGAGHYVRSCIEERARDEQRTVPSIESLGIPTAYLAHGKADAILERLGLSPRGIADAAKSALARRELAADSSVLEPFGDINLRTR